MRELVVLMTPMDSLMSRGLFPKVFTDPGKDTTGCCILWRSRHIWVSLMLFPGVSTLGTWVGSSNGLGTDADSLALLEVALFCPCISYGGGLQI